MWKLTGWIEQFSVFPKFIGFSNGWTTIGRRWTKGGNVLLVEQNTTILDAVASGAKSKDIYERKADDTIYQISYSWLRNQTKKEIYHRVIHMKGNQSNCWARLKLKFFSREEKKKKEIRCWNLFYSVESIGKQLSELKTQIGHPFYPTTTTNMKITQNSCNYPREKNMNETNSLTSIWSRLQLLMFQCMDDDEMHPVAHIHIFCLLHGQQLLLLLLRLLLLLLLLLL